MSILSLLKDFSGWTSAHGVPLIGAAKNRVIRIWWIVILLACMGMFSYQLYDIISTYLKYEVSVATELRFEERDFPAITICTDNLYKASTISLSPRLEAMVQNYSLKIADLDQKTHSEWGFEGLNITRYVKEVGRENLIYLAREIGDNELMTESIYDLIVECAFEFKPCDLENDFTRLFDPVYGACFQFNSQSPAKYKNTRSGPEYGLHLLLRNNQVETLPMVETASVKFTIHQQKQYPFIDGFGHSAPVGYLTSFAIQNMITRRLPDPYPSKCTEDQGTVSLLFDNPDYTMETCIRSCFQKKIVTQCGCADPAQDLPTGATFCAADKMECVKKYKVHQFNNIERIPDFIDECSCPIKCVKTLYGVITGNSVWPPNNFLPRACAMDLSKFNNNETECREWHQKNTLRTDIYFVEMTYKQLSERPAYTISDIILNLGGQFGLWLGYSAITVVEFLSLAVLLGIIQCAKRKGPKLEPVDKSEIDHAEDMDEIDRIINGDDDDTSSSSSDNDSDSESDNSTSDADDDSSNTSEDESVDPYNNTTSNVTPPPVTYPIA